MMTAGAAEIGDELATGFVMALIGGAFAALLLARSSLSMPAMIGLVMLMGRVTKNSILRVRYAILGIRERGLSGTDALLDACRKRARPSL